MKRLLILLIACSMSVAAYAQPTMEEKLYYSCKVWGFAKYYHSEVSMCRVNWDSVLLHVLPLVRTAATNAEFNDALDTMLLAAGPMALSTSYLAPITDPELIHNRDWSWIGSPVLRADVQTILDTIRNNFRPHAMCQVDYTPSSSTSSNWGGYLMFPPDTVMLKMNMHSVFPDQDNRLLMFFKMWNMIRYFNPYNYVLSTPIDTTLYHFAVPFMNAPDVATLNPLYLKFGAALDDAHTDGQTYLYYEGVPPGYYTPRLRLNYVEGQYVVIKSMETDIKPGDVITSVDGRTITQWEDSLMPYYSAGSIEIKHRAVAGRLLNRKATGLPETLVVTDSAGTSHTYSVVTVNTTATGYESFFYDYYYPADTMQNVEWSIYNCDIGYMNFGNITDGGTDSAYDAMRALTGIVIDIRNYPISGNAWALTNKMLASPKNVTRLTIPDVTYPGTYGWDDVSMGVAGNPTPYNGKIVVIVDELTQSAAEYTTMMLRQMPDCTVIGSHTAGADGNITYLQPSYDSRLGWTSLGVFYPNGDSTQRIGIVPDEYAYPTKEGVRHHRDYVLERALTIAGCNLFVGTPNVTQPASITRLVPNPVSNELTIVATGKIQAVEIYNLLGQAMYSSACNSDIVRVNVASLPAGMYLAKINGTDVRKFVKE